jgi:hypothetical protein
MKTGRQIATTLSFSALALAVGLSACSGNHGLGSAANGGDDGGASSGGGGCYGGCVNTDASSGGGVFHVGSSSGATGTVNPNWNGSGDPSVDSTCSKGAETSISGKVYDPAGNNPLWNIIVEVAAVDPIDLSMTQQGASCAACSSLYTTAQSYAYTDETGSFTIHHAASGMQKLIVQIGKWRNVYNINVTKCQGNSQADKSLRLPSKHNSTGANLPQIAVSTGSADSLECIFHRIGIDDSEYTGGPGGTGHIHIFTATNNGGPGASVTGGSPPPEQQLWDSLAHLMPYDVTLFSCEGAETNALTDAARTNLNKYIQAGGRAFASHYHYSWFTPTGPFATQSPPMAQWQTGFIQDNDPIGGVIQTTTASGAPFPEGVSLGKWLNNVGATQSGKLYPIHYSRDNATVNNTNTKTQLWIAADNSSANPGNAQYLSTDVSNGDNVCGRLVYSDLHVSGGPNNSADINTDYPGFSSGICPSGCATHPLSAQEKALEFMIFDLSSCLVKVGGEAGVADIPM